MPNYDFTCTACGLYVEDVQLPMDNRDDPTLENCPSCNAASTIQRVWAAPNIGDSVRSGRTNMPSTWANKLSEIKSKHRHSTIKVPSAKREL